MKRVSLGVSTCGGWFGLAVWRDDDMMPFRPPYLKFGRAFLAFRIQILMSDIGLVGRKL